VYGPDPGAKVHCPDRGALGPPGRRTGFPEGGGPLFAEERWPAIGSAVPRSKGAKQRPPVEIESEKSLCSRPPRIPFSLRAANTLAQVRLHPAEADVEGGKADWRLPSPPPQKSRAPGAPDPSPEFINQRRTPLLDGVIAAKPGLKENRSTTSAIGSSSSTLLLELGIERFAAKSRIDGGLEGVSVPAEKEIP